MKATYLEVEKNPRKDNENGTGNHQQYFVIFTKFYLKFISFAIK